MRCRAVVVLILIAFLCDGSFAQVNSATSISQMTLPAFPSSMMNTEALTEMARNAYSTLLSYGRSDSEIWSGEPALFYVPRVIAIALAIIFISVSTFLLMKSEKDDAKPNPNAGKHARALAIASNVVFGLGTAVLTALSFKDGKIPRYVECDQTVSDWESKCEKVGDRWVYNTHDRSISAMMDGGPAYMGAGALFVVGAGLLSVAETLVPNTATLKLAVILISCFVTGSMGLTVGVNLSLAKMAHYIFVFALVFACVLHLIVRAIVSHNTADIKTTRGRLGRALPPVLLLIVGAAMLYVAIGATPSETSSWALMVLEFIFFGGYSMGITSFIFADTHVPQKPDEEGELPPGAQQVDDENDVAAVKPNAVVAAQPDEEDVDQVEGEPRGHHVAKSVPEVLGDDESLDEGSDADEGLIPETEPKMRRKSAPH